MSFPLVPWCSYCRRCLCLVRSSSRVTKPTLAHDLHGTRVHKNDEYDRGHSRASVAGGVLHRVQNAVRRLAAAGVRIIGVAPNKPTTGARASRRRGRGLQRGRGRGAGGAPPLPSQPQRGIALVHAAKVAPRALRALLALVLAREAAVAVRASVATTRYYFDESPTNSRGFPHWHPPSCRFVASCSLAHPVPTHPNAMFLPAQKRCRSVHCACPIPPRGLQSATVNACAAVVHVVVAVAAAITTTTNATITNFMVP